MRIWKIPMKWQEQGTVEIKAKTLKEAIEIATDRKHLLVPEMCEVIDGSFELKCNDVDYIRFHYNGGQEDEIELGAVIHGRWITDGLGDGERICSVCRRYALYTHRSRYDQYQTAYCPNCGAKMDLESEVKG